MSGVLEAREGRVISRGEKGVVFDEARIGPMVDPEPKFYEYSRIVGIVDEVGAVTFGKARDLNERTLILNVVRAGAGVDARRIQLRMSPNKPFAYLIEPGKYEVVDIRFVAGDNRDVGVVFPRLQFTIFEGKANYLGDIYLDVQPPVMAGTKTIAIGSIHSSPGGGILSVVGLLAAGAIGQAVGGALDQELELFATEGFIHVLSFCPNRTHSHVGTCASVNSPLTAVAAMDRLSVGAFYDALVLAKKELSVLRKAGGTKPYMLADAQRTIETVERINAMDIEMQGQVREAFYSWEEELKNFEGSYLRSTATMESSVKTWERLLGADNQVVGDGYATMAMLYLQQGRYAESERFFEHSVSTLVRTLGPDHPRLAVVIRELALLFVSQTRYSEAEPLARRSLRISENVYGPDNADVARALDVLATVLYFQRRFAEAETLYKRSITVLGHALASDPRDLAASTSHLASLYCDQGEYAKAESILRSSVSMAERALGSEHPDVAVSVDRLAIVCMEEGRSQEAESLFTRALTLTQSARGPNHRDTALLQFHLGILRRTQGQHAEAERLALSAWTTLHGDLSRNGLVLAESDALTYARDLRASASLYLSCDLDGKVDSTVSPDECADIVLMTKGAVSDAVYSRRGSVFSNSDSAAVALSNELVGIKRQRSQLFVSDQEMDRKAYNKQVKSLVRQEKNLEAELALRSSSFRDYQDSDMTTMARLSQGIPLQSALVEYLRFQLSEVGSDRRDVARYLALVISSGSLRAIVDLGGADAIDHEVARYRTHFAKLEAAKIDRADREETDRYYEITSSLYEKVWKPVEPYVQDAELVLVSPDGALNVVSFAGLWDSESKKYVIEKQAIHYLSAGRDLIRYEHDNEPGKGLLAMGMPDFGATVQARGVGADTTQVALLRGQARAACGDIASLKWDALPGTGAEVDAIVKSWQMESTEPVFSYTGAQASEERFKAEAPGSRVIHLATHGYYLQKDCNPTVTVRSGFEEPRFVGENPLLLSGLALAGANLHGRDANVEGAEDGILTAYEVAAMDLEGTEMVVLSACETGLGTVEEGEGVYGLRRAFLMAGARTVVSALWSVPDQVTAEMMGKLYEESDKPIYQRVQELQLERINQLRSRQQSDHPLSWGAFIVVGDPN
jgi:CHAT domain-containing protein